MRLRGVEVTWGGAHRELWHFWRTFGTRRTWRLFRLVWKTRKAFWIATRDPYLMQSYLKMIAYGVARP